MNIDLTEKEQALLYEIIVRYIDDIEKDHYINETYYPKETLDNLNNIAHKLKPEWR